MQLDCNMMQCGTLQIMTALETNFSIWLDGSFEFVEEILYLFLLNFELIHRPNENLWQSGFNLQCGR